MARRCQGFLIFTTMWRAFIRPTAQLAGVQACTALPSLPAQYRRVRGTRVRASRPASEHTRTCGARRPPSSTTTASNDGPNPLIRKIALHAGRLAQMRALRE
jgi:hypothetical protein